MSAKTYRLLTTLIILLGAIGIGGIGLSLIVKYLQTQQIQQIQQANNFLAQKKYDSALSAYDRLLEQKLQSEGLLTNRGYALLGLQRYQEALESCTAATSAKPKADLAWNCRGEALYYLERHNDALTAFKKAIALNPSNPTFQLNQGRVLTELSLHQEAIDVLSQGISQLESKNQSSPQNLAIAFNDLGQSLLVLGKNQRALTAFESSLTYQPNSLSAQQGQGIALYRLGRYQQAIEMFETILQRSELTKEQQAINWLYKGISLCQTPQAETATEAFTQVLQLTNRTQLQNIARSGCGLS